MIELLDRAAATAADRRAVVTDEYSLTFGELRARALLVAANLTTRGIDRFAVVEPDAAHVIALLAGASLVGARACQYPPDASPDDVRDLSARFDHDVLVTGRDDLAAVTVLRPADLLDEAAAPVPYEVPAERPHLILTTGTTGAPRGVRHDWTRLVRATSRIAEVADVDDQRWLLAYGPHQFAGLQVLLHVLAARATLVAPAPRRPREGLAAMRRHAVTHASATPTYWRFLLAELRSDGGTVPALTQITLGGEAIPAPLLTELGRTFVGTRISQVYAASEFGSSGSQRDGRSGLSLGVLDRGDDADIDMRVVDGELWVRSRVGMLGYHGEAPVDADGWRPTGDLVEIVDDRIHFRGRTSEVINVGGLKVHPLPIEERVGGIAGVDMARVYGRPNAMTGAIVAVEIVAAPGADHRAIDAAIRAACADLVPAARPRSIKFVDTVATAGTKIVRRAL